jgi:UDP:flavonoid glycosyltransferase YjiC (YdhE family)
VRIGNSWFFEWCPIRDELLEIADYALIRGGHSTITKAISLGKPMLVLPISNHTEQIGNAERVEELGLGIYLRSSDISGKKLIESMEMIASNHVYKSKVNHLKKISSEYDAVATCVQKISEACEK